MRRFGEGIARRAKWIWGGIILGLGWYLNNLFGTVVMDWSATAVKTPGVKRLIALATLFLASHPFATYFAILGAAMLWITWLAYRDSQRQVLAPALPANATEGVSASPPRTSDAPAIAPVLKPNIQYVTCRKTDIEIAVEGGYIYGKVVAGVHSRRAAGIVLVFSNNPDPSRTVGAVENVRAQITVGDMQVPSAMWLGHADTAKFPVGGTRELLLAVHGSHNNPFMAVEYRQEAWGVLPPGYFRIPDSFAAQVRLFSDNYVTDVELDVNLTPDPPVVTRRQPAPGTPEQLSEKQLLSTTHRRLSTEQRGQIVSTLMALIPRAQDRAGRVVNVIAIGTDLWVRHYAGDFADVLKVAGLDVRTHFEANYDAPYARRNLKGIHLRFSDEHEPSTDAAIGSALRSADVEFAIAVDLVSLHDAGQLLIEGLCFDGSADSVQQEPRGLLRHVESAGDFVGRDPVLAARQQPDRREPLAETDRRVLEDRADAHGELFLAPIATPDPARRNEAVLPRIAARTEDTSRPAHGDGVRKGVVLVRKVDDRFVEGFRDVRSRGFGAFLSGHTYNVGPESACVKYVNTYRFVPAYCGVVAGVLGYGIFWCGKSHATKRAIEELSRAARRWGTR